MTSAFEAIDMIDELVGTPTPEQARAEQVAMNARTLASLGLMPQDMGGISTKGCDQCGATMYLTEDEDGTQQWVCSNTRCAAVQ